MQVKNKTKIKNKVKFATKNHGESLEEIFNNDQPVIPPLVSSSNSNVQILMNNNVSSPVGPTNLLFSHQPINELLSS